MGVVYLNFIVISGTRVTGGHRSSNGWVTSWIDYTNYCMTSNSKEILLSIKACKIVKDFISKYENKSEKDQDWGVYIEESSCSNNIDITPLIQKLNDVQKEYEFRKSNCQQEFNISDLLSFSEKEYSSVVNLINDTERELKNKIEHLKKDYENIKLKRIYPHFYNLVINHQIDFHCHFADTPYYPLDIIALNKDIDLLLKSICKFTELKFEYINDIYTLLMISKLSYVNTDTLNQEFSMCDREKITKFIRELESKFGNETFGKNIYGNEQYFRPKLLKGMLDTIMYYLLNRDYKTYHLLLNQPIYKHQQYILDGLLKFAYLSDAKWDKFTFNALKKTSDQDFFESRILGSVCTHSYWKPFIERILNNQNIIDNLTQIFFFKDESSSKDILIKHLRIMIDKCNTNHENYPFFW